jgi:hypothetical protein
MTWLLRPSEREPVVGDLLEEYRLTKFAALGPRRANLWYLRQLLSVLWHLVRPCVLLIAVIAFLSLRVKALGYGSIVAMPLLSIADVAVYFSCGCYAARRTALVRTAAIVGAITGAAGMASLLVVWSIGRPALLVAPVRDPFIAVIVAVMLLSALAYGALTATLGGIVGRRWPPKQRTLQGA